MQILLLLLLLSVNEKGELNEGAQKALSFYRENKPLVEALLRGNLGNLGDWSNWAKFGGFAANGAQSGAQNDESDKSARNSPEEAQNERAASSHETSHGGTYEADYGAKTGATGNRAENKDALEAFLRANGL